jgi:hypothetical protein
MRLTETLRDFTTVYQLATLEKAQMEGKKEHSIIFQDKNEKLREARAKSLAYTLTNAGYSCTVEKLHYSAELFGAAMLVHVRFV